MKNIITIALIIAAASFTATTNAHTDHQPAAKVVPVQQTVIYSIENMTCKLCDITIRKAMKKVDGVIKATVDFESKTAVVVFNPAKTDVATIGLASTNAGYKATVK